MRSDPVRDRAKTFLSSTLLTRRQQHRHIAPFHPGMPVRLSDVPNLFNHLVYQGSTQFGMGNLPTAKRNGELNTLAVRYKASDVLNFEFDIMLFR